jgi:hypothetical protein
LKVSLALKDEIGVEVAKEALAWKANSLQTEPSAQLDNTHEYWHWHMGEGEGGRE